PPRSTRFPYTTLFRSPRAQIHRDLGGLIRAWLAAPRVGLTRGITARGGALAAGIAGLHRDAGQVQALLFEHLAQLGGAGVEHVRSEEHTSELQSRENL